MIPQTVEWLTIAMFCVAGVAAFAGLVEAVVLIARFARRAVVRWRIWRLRRMLAQGQVPHEKRR